jgi:hypothetical protein
MRMGGRGERGLQIRIPDDKIRDAYLKISDEPTVLAIIRSAAHLADQDLDWNFFSSLDPNDAGVLNVLNEHYLLNNNKIFRNAILQVLDETNLSISDKLKQIIEAEGDESLRERVIEIAVENIDSDLTKLLGGGYLNVHKDVSRIIQHVPTRGNKDGAQLLEWILGQTTIKRNKIEALHQLGTETPEKEQGLLHHKTSIIAQYLSDSDETLRLYAVSSLHCLLREQAIQYIKPLERDSSEAVRKYVSKVISNPNSWVHPESFALYEKIPADKKTPEDK